MFPSKVLIRLFSVRLHWYLMSKSTGNGLQNELSIAWNEALWGTREFVFGPLQFPQWGFAPVGPQCTSLLWKIGRYCTQYRLILFTESCIPNLRHFCLLSFFSRHRPSSDSVQKELLFLNSWAATNSAQRVLLVKLFRQFESWAQTEWSIISFVLLYTILLLQADSVR